MDSSNQPITAIQIIRDLGMEREWTVAETGGAGFVAWELGTWLTTKAQSNGSELLHIEVRLAQQVEDNDETREFLEARNNYALLGRWVLDPTTGVVALVADLFITDATLPFVVEAVAEMVNTAETMANLSVPQRFLDGVTALTLVEGRRRPDPHELVEHLPDKVYPEGESDLVPARLLPQIQRSLAAWLPDWQFEHDDDRSTAHRENWTFAIRSVSHPHAGWGLQVIVTPCFSSEREESLRFGERFNRGDSHVASEVAAPGCWTYSHDRLEYRILLAAWLLRSSSDTDSLGFVQGIIQGVAARSVSPLLQDAQAEHGPTLTRPMWPNDDEAIVLARRHPINDGEDVPDSFVWLDYGERASHTTEESFRLWRSQLQSEDLSDKGVVGYSKWFERELALRPPRRARTNDGTEGTSDD